MIVVFTSRSEKKAIYIVRRILDLFADRIGNDTWQTVITAEGLETVRTLLRKNAVKNMAVSCRWIHNHSYSELLWIVGNRSYFNECGMAPVNWTAKNLIHSEWENAWQYLPVIKALAAVAALLHDWGKGSDHFQKKLKDRATVMDPFRHEWMSCKLLEAIAAGKSDEEWLSLFADGKLDEAVLKKHMEEEAGRSDPRLRQLPPIANLLVWLILSHHRLPDWKEKNAFGDSEKKTLTDILHTVGARWGYENQKNDITDAARRRCFSFSEGFLWDTAPRWRKMITKWSRRLKDCSDTLSFLMRPGQEGALRLVLLMARLSLMMGDHYVSSLPKDTSTANKNAWQGQTLWANTDKKGGGKQYLAEHIVKVTAQALSIACQIPRLAGTMESAHDVRFLRKKSPPAFAWQNRAAEKIRAFRKEHEENTAWFIVNMASTGCGKTTANAKIMEAVSPDGKSLRYVLALGLRSLTLQTGDEYRKRIGLGQDDLAVVIGSAAVQKLHQMEEETEDANGSESAETLFNSSLSYTDTMDQGRMSFLDLFFGENQPGSAKNRAILCTPVVSMTIDHMMGAVQAVRGGKYMLPMLRLLSSDLVIDEIDDFDKTDLLAIARLIHLAGMLGRNVAISSATIPPDLAAGLYTAYQKGLAAYNQFFSEKKIGAVLLCDEFRASAQKMASGDIAGYETLHSSFTRFRAKKLTALPARRKGLFLPCMTPIEAGNLSKEEIENSYFETIRQEAECLHQAHYVTDQKTGKKISFGLIRLANINPCVHCAQYLLNAEWGEEYTPRIMAYHSRQALLLRHEQEQYLDGVLKRNGEGHVKDIQDPTLRRHIDGTDEENLLFIVVSTPVEEVGRDHDFDWAIVEPSSYRSVIQLAGRVMRHRKKEAVLPNVALLRYNLRALKGGNIAFRWPGYETKKYRMKSHDVERILEADVLDRIDAVPRILRPAILHPEERWTDLEHQTMADFRDLGQKGPAGLEGWFDEAWWLTALPEKFNHFRGSGPDDLKCFLRYNGERIEFGGYENGKWSSQTKKLHIEKAPEIQEKIALRLWIHKDYRQSLANLIEKTGGEENLDRYGEITIPDTSGTDTAWYYSDQFGLFKKE